MGTQAIEQFAAAIGDGVFAGEHLEREGGLLLGGFLQFLFAKAESMLLVEQTDGIEGLTAGEGLVIKVVDAVAGEHEAVSPVMQGGGMDEHSVQIENDCLIFLHKVKASLPILTYFEKLPGEGRAEEASHNFYVIDNKDFRNIDLE